MTAERLIGLLSGKRMRCTTECALQQDIAGVLQKAGVAFEREYWLGAENGRIDFLIDTVGLEIKIKGGARDIHRQCIRYCAHPSITTLVLGTTRAISLPALEKPVLILDLSRAWL